MKKLLVLGAAVLALAAPATSSAMVIAGDGGGGGGPACAYGIMNHDGWYYGTIPYYNSNTFVQIEATITNNNVLGFLGGADLYTYASSYVSSNFFLWPWGSVHINGPTYTTPWNNTSGVPFRIDLGAYSDAVLLSYRVCV